MHLDNDKLNGLKNGLLSASEEEDALLHISQCGQCAERFSEFFRLSQKSPPAGFSESIAWRIRSKRREFLLYSVRVMVSVAASLVIVFTTAFPEHFTGVERWMRETAEKTRIIRERIGDNLNEFNFDGGIFRDENQKK